MQLGKKGVLNVKVAEKGIYFIYHWHFSFVSMDWANDKWKIDNHEKTRHIAPFFFEAFCLSEFWRPFLLRSAARRFVFCGRAYSQRVIAGSTSHQSRNSLAHIR